MTKNRYDFVQNTHYTSSFQEDRKFVHDVALLELVNPVTNCDLGHEHLQVRLTNNGTTDILPPIQLHYTVNGGATVSENFTDTLHSHETTVFTFNSIYDFTNNQIDIDDNYAIRLWATKLPQDRLTYNDTLGITVVSKGKAVTAVRLLLLIGILAIRLRRASGSNIRLQIC